MANELQFVLYNIDQEDIKIKVAIKDETIWITQRGMAELFDCSTDNISLHLKIFIKTENYKRPQLPRISR